MDNYIDYVGYVTDPYEMVYIARSMGSGIMIYSLRVDPETGTSPGRGFIWGQSTGSSNLGLYGMKMFNAWRYVIYGEVYSFEQAFNLMYWTGFIANQPESYHSTCSYLPNDFRDEDIEDTSMYYSISTVTITSNPNI